MPIVLAHSGPTCLLNWHAGWILLLAGFGVGAVVGLAFARDDLLGGYGSWRRRLVRLGHVALVALGILNLVYSVAPGPTQHQAAGWWAGVLLVTGGFTMPAVCFLSAWQKPLRHLFAVPVACLMAAAVLALLKGGLR
jgi:hypothetical protein